MHRARRFNGWLAGLVVSLAIPTLAHAQPAAGDRAVAEALFQEGRQLIESGQTAAACRKFEESYRLDKAPGTLLNMAHCHKLEGKVATAWSEFYQVAAEARRDGRGDREQIAVESIKELEPKIPKLLIEVPDDVRVEGLTVTRNGVEMGRAAWGTETPVDPGEIVIEAEAPGYKKWSQTITVEQAEREKVVVPALVKLPKPKEPPKPPPGQQQPTTRVVIDESPSAQTAGILLGGVGLIGIGVGSYFGVQALGKRSDAEDKCTLGPGGDGCPQDAADLNQEAKDAARIANLGIGVGIVAVLAGTYLYLDGAPKERVVEGPAVDVGFNTLPGGGFATVRGGW